MNERERKKYIKQPIGDAEQRLIDGCPLYLDYCVENLVLEDFEQIVPKVLPEQYAYFLLACAMRACPLCNLDEMIDDYNVEVIATTQAEWAEHRNRLLFERQRLQDEWSKRTTFTQHDARMLSEMGIAPFNAIVGFRLDELESLVERISRHEPPVIVKKENTISKPDPIEEVIEEFIGDAEKMLRKGWQIYLDYCVENLSLDQFEKTFPQNLIAGYAYYVLDGAMRACPLSDLEKLQGDFEVIAATQAEWDRYRESLFSERQRVQGEQEQQPRVGTIHQLADTMIESFAKLSPAEQEKARKEMYAAVTGSEMKPSRKSFDESLTGSDIEFLLDMDIYDFSRAGSLWFQHLIRERVLRGAAFAREHEERIRAMKLGYPW